MLSLPEPSVADRWRRVMVTLSSSMSALRLFGRPFRPCPQSVSLSDTFPGTSAPLLCPLYFVTPPFFFFWGGITLSSFIIEAGAKLNSSAFADMTDGARAHLRQNRPMIGPTSIGKPLIAFGPSPSPVGVNHHLFGAFFSSAWPSFVPYLARFTGIEYLRVSIAPFSVFLPQLVLFEISFRANSFSASWSLHTDL